MDNHTVFKNFAIALSLLTDEQLKEYTRLKDKTTVSRSELNGKSKEDLIDMISDMAHSGKTAESETNTTQP